MGPWGKSARFREPDTGKSHGLHTSVLGEPHAGETGEQHCLQARAGTRSKQWRDCRCHQPVLRHTARTGAPPSAGSLHCPPLTILNARSAGSGEMFNGPTSALPAQARGAEPGREAVHRQLGRPAFQSHGSPCPSDPSAVRVPPWDAEPTSAALPAPPRSHSPPAISPALLCPLSAPAAQPPSSCPQHRPLGMADLRVHLTGSWAAWIFSQTSFWVFLGDT